MGLQSGWRFYLYIPTFASDGALYVPYSSTMNNFYTSPLGDYTFFIANILFWIWFVNVNVGAINALPLYPLDGGQALKSALQSYGNTKGWKENTVKRITRVSSLLLLFIFIVIIVAPYLFA
jgi:membrane-associated protease RseP (regulator of RpoE activity)